MQKFKLRDGWTKQKVMEQFKQMNNGTKAMRNSDCAYRTDEGNACAVGAFIPEELYNVRWDNDPILADSLIKEVPELDKFMPLNKTGMRRMQKYHDHCESEYFAEKNNIEFTNGNTYKSIEMFLEKEVY